MSSQTRPIKDLWLWSSARQEFVQAQLRNLFQHVSLPYSRSITFSVLIVFFGCLGGPSKKFLSEFERLLPQAEQALIARMMNGFVLSMWGTRWYRAPEARGERMLILSGIFWVACGRWTENREWDKIIDCKFQQIILRLLDACEDLFQNSHKTSPSFATRFSIFGFPRWCSPPRNTQLLLICGASVAYWESLWAEKVMFLA